MDISMNYSIEKVGLPFVVTDNKPNLCFIVDTGATHNILFNFVYEHLKTSFNTNKERCFVMGIDGEKKETIRIETQLSFGGQIKHVMFSVVDSNNAVEQIQLETGIQLHGILGIPFLTDSKWILDFNDLIIKTYD